MRSPSPCVRSGRSWTMVEPLAGMAQSDTGPLTLCYLTVPRDPQSIVVVSLAVAPEAHRLAEGLTRCAASVRRAPDRALVRARTWPDGGVSARRLTACRSGS